MAIVDSRDIHRSAQCETVVVAASARANQIAFPVIGERHARVQRLIDEVFVARAVELISAASHGDVEEAATHLSELRRIVAGLHSHFLNRIHAGLRDRLRRAPAVIGVLALYAERHGVTGGAVQADARIGTEVRAGERLQYGIGIADAGGTRR